MEKSALERSAKLEVKTESAINEDKFKDLARRLVNLAPKDVAFVKSKKSKGADKG